MKEKFLNTKGLSLVEVLVVLLIFTILGGGLMVVLNTGQRTWFNADTQIELQQSMRKTLISLMAEIEESGIDKNGVSQLVLSDGIGANGTDVVKFSVPIVCQAGSSVLDASGDVAYWGAPLTWGCTAASCMDADNNCSTLDYKYLQYLIVNGDQLVRRVLNSANGVVREDLMAEGVSDLQSSVSADGRKVTVQITMQKMSVVNRLITLSSVVDVYLRNGG